VTIVRELALLGNKRLDWCRIDFGVGRKLGAPEGRKRGKGGNYMITELLTGEDRTRVVKVRGSRDNALGL